MKCRKSFAVIIVAFGCFSYLMPACNRVNASDGPRLKSNVGVNAQTEPQSNTLILFVSPTGNDEWSGRLDSPNANNTDGPLATIKKARNTIRSLKKSSGGLKRPVTVMLRNGTFFQPTALRFDPSDSGTNKYPITYQAYNGEKPVISGGMIVKGWKREQSAHSINKCDNKLWSVHLSDVPNADALQFNNLFVEGRRRQRARMPNKGKFFRSKGPVSPHSRRKFFYHNNDLKNWEDLDQGIAVVYHSWETSIHHFQAVNTQPRRVTFKEPAPWPIGRRWEKQQRYYIENIFEGLDSPGEWYFNKKNRTLYYYPLPGETMDSVEVIVPRVGSTLVQFDGDPTQHSYVDHLHFKGISFQDTNANLTNIKNPLQAEVHQTALIMGVGLRYSIFENCEVAHTGGHGIWMGSGSKHNSITQCHLHDLGGGGVYIGGGWDIQMEAPVHHITVDNCFIHDGGHLFHGAHGVWIGHGTYNRVVHNEISNFDYTGISCGWSWNFSPSRSHHNTLEFNHIHHLGNGEGLSDMGGIYTLGVSPGTAIRNNHIHDIYSYAPVSYGSGIYTDQGSSGIQIENNIVHRVQSYSFFQHFGRNNFVRNNIFAFGGKGHFYRAREDKPCHFSAERNILYSDQKNIYGGVWNNGDWHLKGNIYWNTNGKPDFNGLDFLSWTSKNNEKKSVVADPMFVDALKGDFRLKNNSPAIKMGFVPIDMDKIGLYGDTSWKRLPTKYPNRSLVASSEQASMSAVIHFAFENEKPETRPFHGEIIDTEEGGSIVVSEDAAATGRQGLKFVDRPGLRRRWMPHINFRKTLRKGNIHFSWDMRNHQTHPGTFSIELRDYLRGHAYVTGPNIRVHKDGTVSANKQTIGKIPLGKWAHVEIRFSLGKQPLTNYQVSLYVPGKKTTTAQIPLNAEIAKINWLGISSLSDDTGEFHLDNLKLGTPEELLAHSKQK